MLPRYFTSSLPGTAEQGRCGSEQVKCRSSSLGCHQGDAEQGHWADSCTPRAEWISPWFWFQLPRASPASIRGCVSHISQDKFPYFVKCCCGFGVWGAGMPSVCSCQSRDKDPVERGEQLCSATDGSATLLSFGWCFCGFSASGKITEGEIDARKEMPSNPWLVPKGLGQADLPVLGSLSGLGTCKPCSLGSAP